MLAVSDLKDGLSLPGLEKQVSQEKINRYASVSKDFNPIHIDEDYARKTSMCGTIAHGMMVLAYISQMMTAAFGRHWLTGGQLNIRFKAPARPGDIITVSGRIRHVEKDPEQNLVDCDVLCQNQAGESLITGEARVRIANDENSS